MASSRKAWLGALVVVVLGLAGGAAPAHGDGGDPLFVFIPTPPLPPAPPTGYLDGPCGLAVDASGDFYVSDYYHHAVDVFTSGRGYVTQIAAEDPVDGPCGLALDSTYHVYVNNYHRNVVKFTPSEFPPHAVKENQFGVVEIPATTFDPGTIFPLPAEDTAHHLPTGVAVDSAAGRVYADNRTYISAYDLAGNPVIDGLGPLRIGLGTLGDGYGLAISAYPGTLGRLYVPDAATNTVKVYDPGIDKVNPVASIAGPGAGFSSLRDSAIAVDRVSGEIYVADNTQPRYTERPQALIDVFSPAGVYEGHLKYAVIDALQPGLAVDNSSGATQGRVYVTSGNTDEAAIYGYGPGAATVAPPLGPTASLALTTSGAGAGQIAGQAGIECSGSCEEVALAGQELTFAATPDPGSAFAGWSGACTGTGSCTVTIGEETSLTADFAALSSPNPNPNPNPPSPAAAPSASPDAPPSSSPRPRRRRCASHRRAKHRAGSHRHRCRGAAR